MTSKMLCIDDVLKGAEDKRHYRGLQLENGLKVLLISDEKTDKSAAAMDVHIGRCTNKCFRKIRLVILPHFVCLVSPDILADNKPEYSAVLSRGKEMF